MPPPRAALVHSVVAAGLVDTGRLQAWRAQPATLGQLGIDASAIDLDSLADFAGLAEKIRHNPCRQDLQLTFRLLLLTGLEIKLFRDYASRPLARRRQGLQFPAHRLDSLMQFVEEWSAGADPTRCLIRDALRHEHAVATLGAAEAGPLPGAHSGEPNGSAIPLHNGLLLVHRMTCDPWQLGRILRTRDPDLGRVERGSWTFGYHKTARSPLRMMEMDHEVGDLILAVDGRTSLDGISRRLLGDAATGTLLAAFEQLTALGLLSWRRADGAARCD